MERIEISSNLVERNLQKQIKNKGLNRLSSGSLYLNNKHQKLKMKKINFQKALDEKLDLPKVKIRQRVIRYLLFPSTPTVLYGIGGSS